MSGLKSTIRKIKRAERLLVTPKVEEFLRRHPDGAVWDDDGFALFRDIVVRSRGNDSRSGRFGASSRGSCLRRQVFTYLGMPEVHLIDTDLQNLFNDGKWRHLRWQMMGVQSGALTHAEWPTSLPKYRLKVSMDGLNANDQFIFELKGDRNWSRALDGVPDAHLLQIHTMFLATGWDTAAYVIEDKASNQWREIIVRRDPKTTARVRDELEVLNEHVEDRRLPAILPACAAKEGPYRTCPFASQCLDRHRTGDTWPDRPGDWTT